jgi:hypothetical protein
VLAAFGVRVRADSANGWSLIIQQGGTTQGAAVIFNCSTGLTCSLSGGKVTATASGASSSFGTFGSLPAAGAGNNGDLYRQTDGPYSFIGGSSIWNPFLPVFGAVTIPTAASPGFTWANQGGASVSYTQGGEALAAPANSGDSLRVRYIAAPSTPYSIVAIFNPSNSLGNYINQGLCFYNSSSGKLVTLSYSGIDSITVQYWTSVTAISSAPSITSFSFTGPIVLKVKDDGTNFLFSASSDGQHFLQWFSAARGAFLTPQSVGYFLDLNQGINYTGQNLWLLSWVQGT